MENSNINNFATEWVNLSLVQLAEVVKEKLSVLQGKSYLTTETVCAMLGTDKATFGILIPLMFKVGLLPEYETVVSRGIRRKQVAQQAA